MYNWKCGPHLRRALTSERGVSLYEALIAVALIGVGAAMVSQLDQIIPDKRVTLKRSCDSHAQAVAVAVQEETYYREVINFNPIAPGMGARTIPQPGFTNPTSRALTNAALNWLPTALPLDANRFAVTVPNAGNYNTGVTLHNAELIQGSIRTLTAIYDNTPAVRCTFGDYPPLTTTTALPLSTDLGLPNRNTTVQIMIRPYNVDGSPIGPIGPPWSAANCPSPLAIGPLGEYVANGNFNAFAPGSGFNLTASSYYEDWLDPSVFGYSSTYWPTPGVLDPTFNNTAKLANPGAETLASGFNLDVQITYNNNQGQPEQCNFTQKFEYPRDRKPPPPPNWNHVVPGSNLTAPPIAAVCDPTVASPITVEIGYQRGPGDPEFERGTQFLCRDLSWIKGFAPVVAAAANTYNMPVCVRGPVATPVVSTTDLVYGFYNGFDPALQDFSARASPNVWVPCDRLRQCGVLPTSVSFSQAGANTANGDPLLGQAMFYTLNYAPAGGMPQGCVVNWEVVAVDTGGNTSVFGNKFLDVSNPANDSRRFLDSGADAYTPSDHQINYSACGGTFIPGPTYYGPIILNGGFYVCP